MRSLLVSETENVQEGSHAMGHMTARSRLAHTFHIAVQAAETPCAAVAWRSRILVAALFAVSASSLAFGVALARIAHTTWGPSARIDVVQTVETDVQYAFTDGGAGSTMYSLDGDVARWAALRDTLEYVPFTIGAADQTLVLGTGAGKDILLALLGGAGAVTAVETNPAMVKATRQFADYNGAILDHPQVSLVVGDGRAFVERSSERYDLIYVNLAAVPASQSLVGNYILTRQAFRAYMEHLRPGGRLAIVSDNALQGSRAAITGLQALADAGEPLSGALRHLALLMLPAQDPAERKSVMLLSKDPLSGQEVRSLAMASDRLGLQPLYLSGVFETPFAPLLHGATTGHSFSTSTPDCRTRYGKRCWQQVCWQRCYSA
jgi:protein-L-isoaspartate O-methyltransferase